MTNLYQEAVQFVSRLQNGMTPLRHAVQHSLQAVSTIKTLLEYNVSCSVNDNKQCRADEVCGELKAKMTEIEDIISTTTGLDDLKLQLRAWEKDMFLVEKRKALGLKISELRTPHIVFLGNPKAEELAVEESPVSESKYNISDTKYPKVPLPSPYWNE
ncbi:hypothetical protein IFM89_007200 [Coptis chinensis]|uniref:Uncharacterized protein n=1 Tax=Coptis chinensis TaxID=261450 RepID=A0A835LB87_9MAGN|nr:hypothetical protein IFM89_007200 [Coptis chinensis]